MPLHYFLIIYLILALHLPLSVVDPLCTPDLLDEYVLDHSIFHFMLIFWEASELLGLSINSIFAGWLLYACAASIF